VINKQIIYWHQVGILVNNKNKKNKKNMKKKILIADDNDNIRMLLTEFLKSDYELVVFDDGAGILNWLKTGNIPDMIISDVKMPIINGWDLVNNLKLSLFYKNIPIIVLSGIEKSQERIKFLEAGADEYMMKPFSPQELKARINNIFKRYNYESIN
jgi:DNA-binding response OmpR family regulator